MCTDTIDFVHELITCNTNKSPKQLPAGLLQPLPTPRRPLSHIAIDFITNLPESNGKQPYLLLLIASLKSAVSFPSPNCPLHWKQLKLFVIQSLVFMVSLTILCQIVAPSSHPEYGPVSSNNSQSHLWLRPPICKELTSKTWHHFSVLYTGISTSVLQGTPPNYLPSIAGFREVRRSGIKHIHTFYVLSENRRCRLIVIAALMQYILQVNGSGFSLKIFV